MPPDSRDDAMTDRDARVREMLRLYSEGGLTFEAIGRRYGLSRERVRQLLKPQRANIDHDGRRERRLERRAALMASAQEEFDQWPGRGIRVLLMEQVTTGEIARRLGLLGLDVTERQIGDFAARHNLPVRRTQADNHSEAVLRIAVQAAAAASHRAEPESEDAVRLESRLAGWARRNPTVTITVQAYQEWRAAWLSRFPKQASVPWPVTTQTIMRRLGDGVWNQAVQYAGIAHNARGRTRGH